VRSPLVPFRSWPGPSLGRSLALAADPSPAVGSLAILGPKTVSDTLARPFATARCRRVAFQSYKRRGTWPQRCVERWGESGESEWESPRTIRVQLTESVHARALVLSRSLSYGVWPPRLPWGLWKL
jgi:hypothetical protein